MVTVKFMKTFFVLSLLLIAAYCKSSAQTNSLSSPFDPSVKLDADERIRLFTTREWTIQAGMTFDDEKRCRVSYLGHTNMIVYVPVPEQQFDFHLFSMDGKEIPKMSGYKFGQKLKPD